MFSNKLFLVALFSGVAISLSAGAVDLSIALTAVSSSASGVFTLHASVSNLDDDDYAGPVAIRPMLIPSTQGVVSRYRLKGVSLPSQQVPVELRGAASVNVVYQMTLPKVERGHYLVGALVNSDRAISQSVTTNDVTQDLLDAGEISYDPPPPPTTNPNLDFFSDTIDFNARQGYAFHRWRLFKRGPGCTDLDAYFFFVDVQNKKMYDGDYEKSVGWYNMGADYVDGSEVVPYDRYSNSPVYERLPSGDYLLGTWANHTEVCAETDPANNIDLKHFTASRFHADRKADLTMGWQKNTALPIAKEAMFRSDFGEPATWEVVSLPPGMSVSPTSGTMDDSTSYTNLTLNWDPTSWEPGLYSMEMVVKVQPIDGAAEFVKVPMSFQVFAVERIAATVSDPIEMNIRKPGFLINQTISVNNNGNEDIWAQLASDSWIIVDSETRFRIPAGEVVRIPVGVDSRTLQAGDLYSGNIQVITTASDTVESISLVVDVLRP